MRKIVILFALLMIVVFIIYKNSSNNNEKRTVNKHSQILFPLVKTKKEGKQIPKRVRKISKNEKRMNQQELSIFIQDELKDFFPDLTLELDRGCPKEYTFSDQLNKSESSSTCRGQIKLNDELDVMIEQTYLNTRIQEYAYHIEGLEPLSIKFYSLEQIDEMNLWIDGAIVFSIKFENNLVVETSQHLEDIFVFSEKVKNNNSLYFKSRIDFLKEGKKVLVKFLFNLCQATKDSHTCSAYKKTKVFTYPIIEGVSNNR